MRTAIIAPSALLPTYATTGYHLCLCHQVLKSDVYAFFYKQSGSRGDFVILDNSAHELGVGGMLMDMRQAASLTKPNEVVLPDRLFNGEDTVDYAKQFIDGFRDLAPSVMGVPQGTTSGEWERCCRELLSLGVDTIGISKDYESWDGGLPQLVGVVRRAAKETWRPRLRQIHMLGWGRRLWQLSLLASIEQGDIPIRGVDSGKPLVYAWAGIDLSAPGVPRYPKRPEDFFDLEQLPLNLSLKNINVFRGAANDRAQVVQRELCGVPSV